MSVVVFSGGSRRSSLGSDEPPFLRHAMLSLTHESQRVSAAESTLQLRDPCLTLASPALGVISQKGRGQTARYYKNPHLLIPGSAHDIGLCLLLHVV